MATFPALIPSGRTYSPGSFPHTAHPAYRGTETRVRHSNTVLGVRLRLFFPALTTEELLTVRDHYMGQRGRFEAFDLPEELFSGTDLPTAFTPTGHRWRYANRPSVTDISVDGSTRTNLHDLTIELETVPPEASIAGGVRLRARITLRAGSALRGAFFDVTATLDAGAVLTDAATADPALTAEVVLAAGRATPGFLTIESDVTITGGVASIATTTAPVELTSAAEIIPGYAPGKRALDVDVEFVPGSGSGEGGAEG